MIMLDGKNQQQSEQFDPGVGDGRVHAELANSSVATSTTEGCSFRDDKSMASSFAFVPSSPSSCDFWPLLIPPAPTDAAKCLNSVKAYTSAVTAMTLTDKLLYTGSQDGEIFCWSRAGGDLTLLDTFGTKGKGSVKCIVLEQLSARLGPGVIATHQRKVQLWQQEIITGNDKTKKRCKHKLVTTLPTFMDRVTRIGRRVRVRRHETAAWNSHYDLVTSAATVSLSSAGLVLFTASWDRSIKAWSLQSLACLDSVADAHADAINSLHLVPPRRRSSAVLFSASSDGTVRAWEASQGARLSLVSTLHHSSGVNAIAVAAAVTATDSYVWVYAACRDGTVVAWSLRDSGSGDFDWGQRHKSQMLRAHVRAVLCVAATVSATATATATPGEGIVCSGAADGTVRVWRRELDGKDKATWTHTCTAVLMMEKVPVRSVRLADHDGDCILVYGGDMNGVVKVWRI